MANPSEDILLKLRGELDLGTEKFKTKHSKAVNDAIIESQRLINVYKTLQQEFSKIPSGQLKTQYRQFQLGNQQIPFTEKGGITSYAGKALVSPSGVPYTDPTDIIIASRREREAKQREIKQLQRQGEKQVGQVGGLLKEESFLTGKAELERLFSVPTKLGGFGRNIETFNKTLATTGKNAGLSRIEIEKFMKTGLGFNDTVKHMGSNMGNIFRRAIETVPVWMAIRGAIQGVQRAIGETLKFWAEFETAMTNIKIVGEGTEEEYNRLGQVILSFSVKYGVATKEVAEAAKIFAQQGLKINEVINMTKAATLGALVLEKDVASVAEDLTAAVRAYNIPMEDSLLIIDKWMKVQKLFAISAKDLADGMRTGGATAAAFGISIDEFSGHLTAIVETTRKTGSQAANALQMIYTRLFSTAAKTIQTIAQVPIYQTKANEATFEATHIFRKAGDVIDDMAISWKSLTEEQKINLATMVGSRRQAAPFIALMENYHRAIGAQVVSLSAAGEAMKAYELKADTVEVKIKQMQNSWIALGQSIEQTVIWKKAIDFIKGLADAIGYLINAENAYIKTVAEKKSKEIDELTIKKDQLKALKEIREINEKLGQPKFAGDERFKQAIDIGKKAEINLREIFPEIKVEDIPKIVDKMNLDLIAKQVELEMVKEFVKIELAGWDTPNTIKELKKRDTNESRALLPLIKQASKEIKERGGLEKVIEEFKKEKKKQIITKSVDQITEETKKLLAEATRRESEEELSTVRELEVTLQSQVNIMKIKGDTEKEILEYQIQQYENNKKLQAADVDGIKRLQLRLLLEEEITREIYEQANAIEKTLASSIKNIMSGTSGLGSIFTDLNTTMAENYRTIVSEELAKGLMSTGIGEVFGRSMLGLKGQIEKGHESVYKWIVKGHQDAMSGKVSSGVGGMTGLGGRLSALPGFGQGGWFSQPMNWGAYGVKGGKIGPPRENQLTRGDVFAGGVQGLVTGYSAYQSGVSGGLSKGMAGASAGLTGIGSMLSMTPFAPLGWGLTALGTVLQMFGKRKQEQSQVETKTTENKISSKIDVTNKTLEILNRNLLGLRQDVRSYILPQSAYFSEKNTIEQEFSLSSRRGLS